MQELQKQPEDPLPPASTPSPLLAYEPSDIDIQKVEEEFDKHPKIKSVFFVEDIKEAKKQANLLDIKTVD